MKVLLHVSAVLLVLGAPTLALAQLPVEGTPTTAMQAYQSRSGNDMVLRHFSWTTMIQLFNGNTLAQQVILQHTYLPNGLLKKAVLNKEHSTLPQGFVSQAETDYLSDLRDRLEMYRPTAGALMNFLTNAKTTGPDSSGALLATGQNVVVNGDVVMLWLDARTKEPRRIQVGTLFRGDPIQVTATFATVSNGPTYMQYAHVDIPSKQTHVLVHSYDYVRTSTD
jgi:hypothetical protein